MKAPSQRGVIGAWAYQARQELGMSVEQVAAAMGAQGQAVSPATIRGIESGSKRPGARLLRVLASVLESSPPGQASASEESLELRAVLAAERTADAAERQAAALEGLLAVFSGQSPVDPSLVASALAVAAAHGPTPLPVSDPLLDTERP